METRDKKIYPSLEEEAQTYISGGSINQNHPFRGQLGSISQNVNHTWPLTQDSTSRNLSYGYTPT